MQGSQWSTSNQAEQEMASMESHPSQPKGEEYKMEEIISERATQSIEDDLTSLRNKQFQSPLAFYAKVGSSFIFSFKKSEVGPFMARFLCLTIFLIAADIFIETIERVPRDLKNAIYSLTAVQTLSFLLVFFVDPGTLFDDEQQKLDEQRLYCQTCRIYKSHGSTHCMFCLKCVKGYDHHCSFFSKCIGRRNLLLFWCFILSSVAYMVLSIGGLLYPLFQQAVSNSQ